MRVALAALRLAEEKPKDAIDALAPVLEGSAPASPWPGYMAHPLLLEAIAHDALGDAQAAGRALERALDAAEPDGALGIFPTAPDVGVA
jgi:LuxR family maltose regulon positive regulatory protein